MGVLRNGGLGLEETAQRVAIRLRRVLPVSADRIPAVTQTFLVGVAVLGNDRGNAVGMLQGNPQAHRSAVIEDVDRKTLEPDFLRETSIVSARLSKRVFELIAWRQVRLTKARQIGRYKVEAVGEQWNQITEHMPGGRKSVQQEQGRSIGPTRFAIGNLQAISIGTTVMNRFHGGFPLRCYVTGLMYIVWLPICNLSMILRSGYFWTGVKGISVC